MQVEYDDPEKAHAFGQDWSASLDAFAQEHGVRSLPIEPPTAEGAVPAARGFPNSSYSGRLASDLVKRGLEPREWMIEHSTKMAQREKEYVAPLLLLDAAKGRRRRRRMARFVRAAVALGAPRPRSFQEAHD